MCVWCFMVIYNGPYIFHPITTFCLFCYFFVLASCVATQEFPNILWNLAKSTGHEASHYATSSFHMFSASCSHTPIIAIWPVSFDIIFLNMLCQTVSFASSVDTNLDLLCLKLLYSLWYLLKLDRPCGLGVRVLDYRSGGPGSILVNTTEELLDRKVAAPV
jgi:hypothetical protein